MDFKNKLILAPMAGFTDHPMRTLSVRHGADMVVSEMISAKAVTFGDKKTALLAKIEPEDGPTLLQLFGSEPDTIARAIAHRPKIIFADEPTGELDTLTGLQVVKIFKELCQQEGVTIVMTTHDTGRMEIGDAVIELEDGERIDGR